MLFKKVSRRQLTAIKCLKKQTKKGKSLPSFVPGVEVIVAAQSVNLECQGEILSE